MQDRHRTFVQVADCSEFVSWWLVVGEFDVVGVGDHCFVYVHQNVGMKIVSGDGVLLLHLSDVCWESFPLLKRVLLETNFNG